MAAAAPAPRALDAEALDADEQANYAAAVKAKVVKLVSREGHEFYLSKEAAMASGTIRSILTGPGVWKENMGPITEIRLETISTQHLETVVRYCYEKMLYNRSDAQTPPRFHIDDRELASILIAAHYLDV